MGLKVFPGPLCAWLFHDFVGCVCDMNELERAGCCKHAVGVCDNGGKAWGAVDGADGGAGGGDIGLKLIVSDPLSY